MQISQICLTLFEINMESQSTFYISDDRYKAFKILTNFIEYLNKVLIFLY